MQINHRIVSLVFAFGVGLLVSYLSYQWITNPDRAAIRAVEEGVVRESRQILESYVGDNQKIEISDPLDRVREAGRVYLFPIDDGWEIGAVYKVIAVPWAEIGNSLNIFRRDDVLLHPITISTHLGSW